MNPQSNCTTPTNKQTKALRQAQRHADTVMRRLEQSSDTVRRRSARTNQAVQEHEQLANTHRTVDDYSYMHIVWKYSSKTDDEFDALLLCFPVQLNEALDTGKSVEVQCPIISVNGGRRCRTVILDGQKWGVMEGKIYHRIIENYKDGK